MTEALYRDPALAALYDASNGSDARPGGRADFAFVLDRARGAASALDVGCGTGELAVLLSGRCAATGLVTYRDAWTFPDGEVRRSTARLRSPSRGEIAAELGRAGLEAAETYGDWQGSAWDAASPEIVTVARHARTFGAAP